MKVLQVGSALFDWGGIERYLVYLSEGLSARGHEVTAICPQSSPLGQRLSIPRRHIALRGQFRFGTLAPYLRFLRANRFDVVHIHFSPDFIIPALAARMTKQPLVLMTRHVALRWKPAKVRRYLRLFDHIIPVSDSVRQKLLDSGVPAERMTVAKAGCPALLPSESKVESRKRLGISSGEFAAGYFGRLVRDKGVGTLLEAASKANGVRAELFGQGEALAQIQAQADGLGLGERAAFRGYVSDVADAMAAMDAIVIPSLWEEAFPYSALEAMSLGLPIVASRVGGLPEMVQEGVNGLLFEKGNSGELAAALGRLAADSELGAEMGRRAKAIHAAEYTVDKMAERIEAVYLAQVR